MYRFIFLGIPNTVFCIDSCISGSPRCKVFLPEANSLLNLGKKCAIFKDAQRSRNPFLLEMQYVNTGSCISKFSSSHLSCIFLCMSCLAWCSFLLDLNVNCAFTFSYSMYYTAFNAFFYECRCTKLRIIVTLIWKQSFLLFSFVVQRKSPFVIFWNCHFLMFIYICVCIYIIYVFMYICGIKSINI